MRRTIGFVALAAVVSSGCATAKTTYLPDGRPGMSINCSGSALSWDYCYRKAGEICGNLGYDVVAQSGDTGSVVSGNQYGVYGGSIMTRTLLIGCKKPAAK